MADAIAIIYTSYLNNLMSKTRLLGDNVHLTTYKRQT